MPKNIPKLPNLLINRNIPRINNLPNPNMPVINRPGNIPRITSTNPFFDLGLTYLVGSVLNRHLTTALTNHWLLPITFLPHNLIDSLAVGIFRRLSTICGRVSSYGVWSLLPWRESPNNMPRIENIIDRTQLLESKK